MLIRIVTVGTKPRPAVSSLVNTYVNRLPRDYHLEWIYLKHETGDADTSMKREAEKILKSLPDKPATIILLDENGVQFSSEHFAMKLLAPKKDLVFIIGGAYGVHKIVFDRADIVWSLSKLVFPHQLVRLILSEQLYRASTILSSHPYHHA